MAIAFQLQMGFRLGMEGDDLYAQADIMRKMCMKIWRHTDHHIDGTKVSAKAFWRTAAWVPAIKCLIGQRMSGFQRRLVLDQHTWAAVAKHIIAANRRDGDAPGLGYRVQIRCIVQNLHGRRAIKGVTNPRADHRNYQSVQWQTLWQ